jgi:hypothetical protein
VLFIHATLPQILLSVKALVTVSVVSGVSETCKVCPL